MKYELASSSWDGEEQEAIRRVVESGRFTMGENVREYEEAFAKTVGSRHCVAVNSGSSANLLAVAALTLRRENPLRRGDEVLVPALSWPTTYTPFHQYGLKMRFVDIDRHTLNYDLEALAAAVTPQTRAIAVVNILGNPNDFDAVKRIADSHGLVLIEDNCEALGAEWRGRQTGTFGAVGTFSTFFSHHMSTMEGGVVATDDDEIYHILLSIRSHGWTRHLPRHNLVCEKGDDPFEESFRFVLPGYNVRPTELTGAIGLAQLKKLPGFIAARRKNAERFLELFGEDGRFIVQRELGKSSWFGFSLVARDGAEGRREALRRLAAAGIETRPIVAGNFARKEVVRYFDCTIPPQLPNADFVDAGGFFVGNHQFDISDRLELLRSALA